VAQQLLHGADVVARREQMRRERVAQRVTARGLRDAGGADGGLHRALDGGFVEVVAALAIVARIEVATRRGEDPLPAPLAWRGRVLAVERVRNRDASRAVAQITLEHSAGVRELAAQGLDAATRQRRHPILASLAATHADLASLEIHVLHTQRQRLEQPEPRAVEQCRYQPLDA